jgi:hypothetical protein
MSSSTISSQFISHGTANVTTAEAQSTEDGRNAMTLDTNNDAPNGAGEVLSNKSIPREIEDTEVTKVVTYARETQDVEQQREETRPPLPPRPSLLQTTGRPSTSQSSENPSVLISKPTTALSSVDIQTLSFPDGSRGTFSTPSSRAVSESISGSAGPSTPSRKVSRNGSEIDDNASLMSYTPTLKADGDLASLLDEGLNAQSPAWRLLSSQAEVVNSFETIEFQDNSLTNFEYEFDEIEAVDNRGGNEGRLTFIPS